MSVPTRQNQWFQPGEGIAREVITADIQRYLGNDALVRPGEGNGEYEGVPGYWITAYRNLTSQMVQDLRLDSQRWRIEIQQGRVAYQDSSTHRSRQYYGPTAAPASAPAPAPAPTPAQNPADYAQPQQQPQPRAAYPPQSAHQTYPAEPSSYTHQPPPAGYGQQQNYTSAYDQGQGQGRTTTTYAYAPQGPGQDGYYTSAQPRYAYPPQQPASAPQYPAPQQSPANAYYTAADGRTYATNPPPQANDSRRRRQN